MSERQPWPYSSLGRGHFESDRVIYTNVRGSIDLCIAARGAPWRVDIGPPGGVAVVRGAIAQNFSGFSLTRIENAGGLGAPSDGPQADALPADDGSVVQVGNQSGPA